MRIFLAGATGVLGRRIVRLLVAEHHHVTALTRDADQVDALRAAGVDPVVGDVMDATAMNRLLEGAGCDVVIDQLTDLRGGDLAHNAELRRSGTRILVDAALRAGVERIIAQSIAWAYEPGTEPATERTPLDLHAAGPRRTSIEGVAALEAQVARAPHWVVLRYGLLYGPGTWYAPDGSQADEARAGRVPADADVTSWVHVDDAAVAAVHALRWRTGAVNIVDDEPAPGSAWVPAFCAMVGAPPPPVGHRPRTPFARGADNFHARRELGWSPVWRSWRDGFSAMAAPPRLQPAAR